MYIYLLHFDEAIGSDKARGKAQHYIGSAYNLSSRMQQHMTGRGARLTQVLKERGIGFTIARIWPGDRRFERKLKNRKQAPRLCPICRARSQPGQLPLDLPDPLDDLL